ncbi:unnamed protein product [Sphacelaria rigidula]
MGSTKVRKTCMPLHQERKVGEGELDSFQFPSARIRRKLMFLAGMTRPDLPNSVRELRRRVASPCLRYWRGLQHVLRYLADTLDVCLRYVMGTVTIEKALVGYADWIWANDAEHAGASRDTSCY